ncbi:uncharacterized protein C2845_PM05G31990 [Panicum miliaceum]|uniref:Uncharacterized protein n=1 Tax=Panicum miliaceum TaxID=4540 RepID=A0A3L6T2I1_PANMI|nr:uncharacterized protein C2845_PM05G31990 [Panicum miliaceum]
MATVGAPFSIREYAARARAEGEGWPFGGGAGPLPPVEVRRFRWWEDVAAAAVEDEEGEGEGEGERRMAAKRRKRSVAELFAAVPTVARGQGCGKGKAAKRKLDGKEKVVLAVRVKASKGSKKKKAPTTTGIDVREKEKSGGVKSTSISVSQLFQHSIRKRKPKNSLSKEKGNKEVSVLLGRKSKKGNRKSVLERHKKAITNSIRAQSICKKQSKTGFSTVLDNTDIRCKSSSYKSKHVTFSDGTDIFRWTAHLPEDNTEQPQSVQTSQRSTREGHDHRNTDKPQLVCQQADAISGAVENTSSLSENVVSAGVHHAVPLTKPKDRTILGTSVDLNHCIETSNSSNCLNSISLACLSRKVTFQNFNGVNSHLDSDDGLSSDVECLGERNHMVSQASYAPASLTAKAISGDRSPQSQPSSSCLCEKSRSTLQERISDGERQSTGNPSHFSFVPAAVPSFVLDTSSFRTNSHNQQPELATANNRYVRSGGWCNEGEIGHQQPVMAKQVQSNAEDMLSDSMHLRHTQTLAPESSLNRRNNVRDFMEQRQVPSYLPQQFYRMTQRPPLSSFASSYPVQNAPGLTTQTKFTSLRPLPPSVIPSQACNADYAQPHGSITAFHPPVPIPYPVSNPSAPGNAIFEDESMRRTILGSKPEGLEHVRRNYKRPAEKDDAFLTLPKKPCTAALKELSMLPFPEKGLEFRGPRPDPQARDTPICVDDDPEADLRLGNGESHATWSAPASAVVRPLKLKPGAKHVVQPSSGGVYRESPGLCIQSHHY